MCRSYRQGGFTAPCYLLLMEEEFTEKGNVKNVESSLPWSPWQCWLQRIRRVAWTGCMAIKAPSATSCAFDKVE